MSSHLARRQYTVKSIPLFFSLFPKPLLSHARLFTVPGKAAFGVDQPGRLFVRMASRSTKIKILLVIDLIFFLIELIVGQSPV